MLEIKADKTILLRGNEIKQGSVDMRKFLMGSLNVEIKLDKDLKIGDFIHLMYDLKEFINENFIEEYEAIRALVNMGKFISFTNVLEGCKAFETEEGYAYINTTSSIKISDNNSGVLNVCDLTMNLKEELDDTDDVINEKLKVKFTLMDVLNIIFIDFIYDLRNNPILQ